MAKRKKSASVKNMLSANLNGSAPAEVAILRQAQEQAAVQDSVGQEMAVFMVPLEQVALNPYQPRMEHDVMHTGKLAESIRSMKSELPDTLGLQQVPLARIGNIAPSTGSGTGEFEPMSAEVLGSPAKVRSAIAAGAIVQLAFGHSRLAAFQVIHQGLGVLFPEVAENMSGPELDADYGLFPVRLMVIDDRGMWTHVMMENAQRKDLTPMEEAMALQRSIDEFGWSQKEAGKPFGFSRTQVANKLALLRLPEVVQGRIQKGELSETHGRVLGLLSPTPDLIEEVLDDLAENGDGSMPTTREIQSMVDVKFRVKTRPISVEPVKAINRYNSETEFKLDWPEGWEPKEAVEGVHGACAGCSMRVKFGREKFERCVDMDCYDSKSKLWEEVYRSLQIAWVRKEYGDVVVEDWNGLDQFGSYGLISERLITEGYCSFEHCDCLRVVYRKYLFGGYIAVDEEMAPNMLLGCAERKNWKAKLQKLPEDASAGSATDPADEERKRLRVERQEIEEQNADGARERVAQFFVEEDVSELFLQRSFLADLYQMIERDDPDSGWTLEQLLEQIFFSVAEESARAWLTYDENGDKTAPGYYGYDLKKLDAFLERVRDE